MGRAALTRGACRAERPDTPRGGLSDRRAKLRLTPRVMRRPGHDWNCDIGGAGCPRSLDARGGGRRDDGRADQGWVGEGLLAPITWLGSLPSPVWACYEAGPTGFGLYRAATEAGIRVDVIAPGKTPRGPADRVKSDRKDAELLARCLMAGSLTPVKFPRSRSRGRAI